MVLFCSSLNVEFTRRLANQLVVNSRPSISLDLSLSIAGAVNALGAEPSGAEPSVKEVEDEEENEKDEDKDEEEKEYEKEEEEEEEEEEKERGDVN
ncbi:hypothetical protein HZH68_014024 [Vespula germanica]|uniref:Uncharacterized protein n=1 Tax=Vespula germanica TaxID=30212 RepID=A0A834MVW6_VESGE|nr:hypothetical protein HZH68_014024 [Vespula germanica]